MTNHPSPSGPGAPLSAEELIELAKDWPMPTTDAGDVFTGDLLIHHLGRALTAAEAESQRLREECDALRRDVAALKEWFVKEPETVPAGSVRVPPWPKESE